MTDNLPGHRKPRDPGGIIRPLRERIHGLTRSLENLKRTSTARIHSLETENEKLRMAINAIQNDVTPGADEPGTEDEMGHARKKRELQKILAAQRQFKPHEAATPDQPMTVLNHAEAATAAAQTRRRLIEAMAAAYSESFKIPPEQAVLLETRRLDPDGTLTVSYFFTDGAAEEHEALADNTAMANFGRAALDLFKENQIDETWEQVMELAVKHKAGGVRHEPYDPKIHGVFDEDPEPGDMIFTWATPPGPEGVS